MTERKKPGVAFWATVGLFVVLAGYPLSYPWTRTLMFDMTGNAPYHPGWFEGLYAPLGWLLDCCPMSILHLWGAYYGWCKEIAPTLL